jgi:hypothetical protein
MRHVGSLLTGLVIAPLAWVLLALGQGTVYLYWQDDRGTAWVQSLAYLVVAGLLVGLVASTRISPVGPLVAGLAYLGYAGTALVNEPAHNLLPQTWRVLDRSVPLRLPVDNGTAIVLGSLLLVAVISARRWQRWPSAATPTQPAAPPPDSLDTQAPVWPTTPPVVASPPMEAPPMAAPTMQTPATETPAPETPAPASPYWPPAEPPAEPPVAAPPTPGEWPPPEPAAPTDTPPADSVPADSMPASEEGTGAQEPGWSPVADPRPAQFTPGEPGSRPRHAAPDSDHTEQSPAEPDTVEPDAAEPTEAAETTEAGQQAAAGERAADIERIAAEQRAAARRAAAEAQAVAQAGVPAQTQAEGQNAGGQNKTRVEDEQGERPAASPWAAPPRQNHE